MAMIRIDTFRGQIPSYAANLLPNDAAVIASDCHFDDGTLNPIQVNFDTSDVVPISTKILFRYEDQYWFNWNIDVDVMRSPIARDPYRRVYWTDGIYPKVTYNTIFNSGGNIPAASYRLGVPAPENEPIIVSFTPPLDVESAVTVFYTLTYVTGVGEEGPPSDVSARVICAPIGIEINPESTTNITVSLNNDGTAKVVDNDGNAVTGFNYTKTLDPQGSGPGVIEWLENVPASGNELTVSASQMDFSGIRSPTASATILVGDTAGSAGANPPVTDAPLVKITSDINNDGIIVPSEITDGKVGASVTIDHAKLAFGGYISIKIVNGGTTGVSNPDMGKVELSLQPPGTNISNIERVKIYRTVSGAGSSEFLEVANLPISQSSFVDTISDGRLGAVLSTETFAMPPDKMLGLCSMANGICAGFIDNQVLFSEVYLPYAWPEEYRFSIDFDIVAIEPIGTSLVVGTNGDPYLYTGISPANIAGQKLEISQACVSKHSMLNIGPAVIYACPDGLVAIAPDGVRMATENIIKPLQWRKLLDPTTIKAYRHENNYIGIHSTGAFIFDIIDGSFRELNDSWSAGFTEPKDDTLYTVKDGAILRFRGGDDLKSLTWKSKEFTAVSKSFSCCRIVADDISKVGFKLIVDNVVVMTKAAGTMIDSFTLPAVRGDKWQFEIESQSRIESIKIATSKQELKY